MTWVHQSFISNIFKSCRIGLRIFRNKEVLGHTSKKGATGGVLYYEFGTARPDLVLKDIIKICHPELLEDYQPYFFKPLE